MELKLREVMNIKQIEEELNLLINEKYRKNVVRRGIPSERAIGVPIKDMGKLSEKLKNFSNHITL
ncbi:MAG: hypothetical protein LRZ92_01535 [Methanosarcinaceae archaeon]|nr:hypothetical protein [Methanosarcinaceae archaeon]